MTYAFLIAVAAALGSSAVFIALWKGAQLREANTARALELARQEITATHEALAVSEKARGEEAARGASVVAGLRQEIAKLEADLEATNDPRALRDRLRRLLAGEALPKAPAGGGDAGSGGVPG